MNRTIYKIAMNYPVQTVELPRGAFNLDVETQDGKPCMWFEVDPSAPPEQRTFVAHGTGHRVEYGEVYIGTAHNVEHGGLVFHIYERR